MFEESIESAGDESQTEQMEGEDRSTPSAEESAEESSLNGSKANTPGKAKKGRNTAGLLAAAAKRREANALKKAETQRAKEQAIREQYVQQYQSLKAQIGESAAKPYSMKTSFAVASAVNHASFGLGFVTVATPDRIEVAFESGVRQLIHNRK